MNRSTIVALRITVSTVFAATGAVTTITGIALAVPGAHLLGFDARNWVDLHDGNAIAAVDRAPDLTGAGLHALALVFTVAGCAALAAAWVFAAAAIAAARTGSDVKEEWT